MSLISQSSMKRGDTLIEVMFAIGFFALVAIISVAVMNSGIKNAERDLELVTARNELNAQAEALRFIHSSYISEKTLPSSDKEYEALWNKIVSHPIKPYDAEQSGLLNIAGFGSCEEIYNTSGGASPLQKVDAFVINTRKLTGSTTNSYISIKNSPGAFRPTELNARIVFHNGIGLNSDGQLTDGSSNGSPTYRHFDQVLAAEGIWDFVVAEKDSDPRYYDFYIQTCWYGPGALRPTVLDTVIRLYNPENV